LARPSTQSAGSQIGSPEVPLLARPTSSGCASDVALGSAIERGAYELIERDALARHWLAQAPARVIDQGSLTARIQHRAKELEALGCEIFVLCMTLGLGPSILVLIRNLRLGFACAGSACGADAAATIERAFIEAEFAAIARCQGVAVPRIRSRDASVPEDHAHLYAQRAHFRRADVLIGDPAQAIALARIDWPASLQSRLGEQHRLYWVDRSDDGALRQLDGQRICTVRVLIPGCVPLAFGCDALPRAMVSHPVSVRALFPHPLA